MLDDAGVISPDEDDAGSILVVPTPLFVLVLTDVADESFFVVPEYPGSLVPPDSFRIPSEYHDRSVPPDAYGGLLNSPDACDGS